MREIKFRGKTESGHWIYGDLIQYESGEKAILETPFSRYGVEATNIANRTRVIPESIGQDSGILDVTGARIFEGDIITFEFADAFKEYELTGVVEFYEGGYWSVHVPKEGFQAPLFNNQISEMLIVGNETDNPELLD